MEWLMGILHLDSKILIEFMETTYAELELVDTHLKKDSDNLDYSNVLDITVRSLHLIKGNAKLLELNFFANNIHDIEERVIELKQSKKINGMDFIPIVMMLKELKNNLNELSTIIERISKFNKPKNEIITPKTSMISSIKNLINQIAEELNKNVTIDTVSFKEKQIPHQYSLLIRNILVQLVRNSMVHGIESPEERKIFGKDNKGSIEIKTAINSNNFVLELSDDGRGLQIEKLKKKALEHEKISYEEYESLNDLQAMNLIFLPGISSSEKSDIHSGRGFGMDLVQDQLKKYQGVIEVDSRDSEYCKFKITLPLTNQN
jgi:Amt family ammonium transporter